MQKFSLGAAIDFSGVSLPFSPADLLTSTTGLLSVVGGFVLLGLAIIFVPRIIGVIREASIDRDEYGNRKHFQSPEAKAYFEKVKKEKGW